MESCSLVNFPGSQEIKVETILVLNQNGNVIFFEDLKNYLIYLDDLENHDIS